MPLLTPPLIFSLLIFVGQEVNCHKRTVCEADQDQRWSYSGQNVGQEVNCHERSVCEADQNQRWSYSGQNGPENWGNNYPECNGKNQSPINIDLDDTVLPDSPTPRLEFTNYENPVSSAAVVNNGHTVQVTPRDGVERGIQYGGLPHAYTLTQFHFHWGRHSKCGSEHQINGWSFPMEMHLVHTNNGEIAVVAVFFKVVRHGDNKYLGPIIKALRSIRYRDDTTNLTSDLNLYGMLPKNTDFYCRYTGSLTTPGCTEGVTWTVYLEPVPISCRQIEEFRELYSTSRTEPSCPLVDNFRPIQDLNDRTVICGYWTPWNAKRRT